jgi:hypothetical protein
LVVWFDAQKVAIMSMHLKFSVVIVALDNYGCIAGLIKPYTTLQPLQVDRIEIRQFVIGLVERETAQKTILIETHLLSFFFLQFGCAVAAKLRHFLVATMPVFTGPGATKTPENTLPPIIRATDARRIQPSATNP